MNFFESKPVEEVEEQAPKRNYLFDHVLKSINETKQDMFDDTEKDLRFITNMMLGGTIQTVLYANTMNQFGSTMTKRAHYLWLLAMVPKGRRYPKSAKADKALAKKLEPIKKYFGYNNKRAKEVASILTDAQIKEIKLILNEGGRGK